MYFITSYICSRLFFLLFLIVDVNSALFSREFVSHFPVRIIKVNLLLIFGKMNYCRPANRACVNTMLGSASSGGLGIHGQPE